MSSNRNYFKHFHDKEGCGYDSYKISPPAGEHLHSASGKSCLSFVSLGPDGHYFVRYANGSSAWKVNRTILNRFNLHAEGDEQMQALWLGVDGTYVAQKKGGGISWDLGKKYRSLDGVLSYRTSQIAALGLDQRDGSSYIVLFDDGDLQFAFGWRSWWFRPRERELRE